MTGHSERVLTQRELNRALLARQHLLEPAGTAIARTLERVGGLQARYAPGPRRFRSETGETLLDLPRAPIPPAETPAPVRLLPTWDATLLVHARRAGILPEEHRPKIFSVRNPHSHPTFLVDGAVAGTWRHRDGRIELEPFGRLDPATRRALDEEAGRLAELFA